MIKDKRNRFILLTLFLVLIVGGVMVISQGPAQASITVKPMNIYFNTNPGETTTKAIRVENGGTQPTEVTVRLIDWWRTPEGGLQFSAPGSRERSCAEWLIYSPDNLQIPPGESRDITVEISVPENVESDYWASFLVQESSAIGEEEQVTTRISVNYVAKIFYQSPDTQDKSAEISNIKMIGKDPLAFELELKNPSSSYLRITGKLEVRDLQGETVKSIEVDEFGLLPGAKRILTLKPSETSSLDPGQYYAIAVIDFGADHLVQGGLPIEIPKDSEESTA